MKRVTLRLPKAQLRELERRVERGEYPNRSEAIRAAIRDLVAEDGHNRPAEPDWPAVRDGGRIER